LIDILLEVVENYVPDTNNLLEITFKGPYHIFVKVEFRIPLAVHLKKKIVEKLIRLKSDKYSITNIYLDAC
jgi:hypothetical protein